MLKTLYSALIQPRSSDQDIRSRELVLNFVLVGFLLLIALELLDLSFGFIFLKQHYLIYRLLVMVLVFCAFLGLYWLGRTRQKQKISALMIVVLLFGLASTVAFLWGTVTHTGVLLFGLIIVMAGILLGSRFAIYLAFVTFLVLALLEYLKATGAVHPNLTWMTRPSSMSDILGFGIIYAVIALVSWLFNQQMEQSLQRARKSEAALSKQNDWLESEVKERTRQLEAAQLEKVQQVYRFAEMGRISSALFHDLANHLTGVSMDIEGLTDSKQTKIMRQVQNDIRYIDDIVQRVRLQLRGQGSVEKIDIAKEVHKVAKILHYKFVQAHVTLDFAAPTEPICWQGDVIPFRQIINNLLVNAVEAYGQSRRKKKPVQVRITASPTHITIAVTDWGVGIPPDLQTKVFEPFYSSKTDGTGIGLYIVKQIVEHDLHGSIRLTSDKRRGTKFTIELDRQYESHD